MPTWVAWALSTLRTYLFPRWITMLNLVAIGQTAVRVQGRPTPKTDFWGPTFKGHLKVIISDEVQ